ncbi:MAG: ATP-binding protein [Oscillospiraceae bacterium]
MQLFPNFYPVKLPQYNMVSFTFEAGTLMNLPKNVISNVVDAADRMKGYRVILDYTGKDIYPVLITAGILHDRSTNEVGVSSDELWGQLETDDDEEEFFDEMFEDEDAMSIDEVQAALQSVENAPKYKGVCVLRESELECGEQMEMPMNPMLAMNDNVLENTKIIREGNGTTVIICSCLGSKLMKLLEHCESTVKIILVIDMSRANTDIVKRLKFELGFTEAGKLNCPRREEYTEMLKDTLRSSGVNVSDESAAANVADLIRYRGNRFSGMDIIRYNGYIQADNVERLEPDHFATRFNVKHEEHTIDELNTIIGCDNAKKVLANIAMEAALCSRIEKENGKALSAHNNILFTGNPGVGKTMMARIFANILGSMGVTNGSFAELGKDDMVGQFLGQTEKKLKKILSEAAGGVLFIDEASSLLTSDERDIYASTVVSMLVRFMENSPETIVIFATYPNEGEKLLALDKGLKSRIPHQVAFEDYTAEQLSDIFVTMANADGFTVDKGSKRITTPFFEKALKNLATTFGNARAARNLYETARKVHASRCYKDNTVPLTAITRKDITEAVETVNKQMFGVCHVARPIGF